MPTCAIRAARPASAAASYDRASCPPETTVTIPLSIQIADVVDNLAKRSKKSVAKVKELPLTRENLAIVATMAAGESVLPVMDSLTHPTGTTPDPGPPTADPPELVAGAWMPGPDAVDGWLGVGEPWAGGREPAFVDLALLPWVTPVDIAVLVDVPVALGRCSKCRYQKNRLYELDKSQAGHGAGPRGRAGANWPVPWAEAGTPMPRPSGFGEASFAEFAALPGGWFRSRPRWRSTPARRVSPTSTTSTSTTSTAPHHGDLLGSRLAAVGHQPCRAVRCGVV